jgi:V8-like Glu-specific endopeptidase
VFKNVKSSGLLIAALLIVLSASATTLMAGSPGQGAMLVSSPSEPAEDQREWTPERMEAALPYPMPSPSATGERGNCRPGEPTGPPSLIPGHDESVEWTPSEPQTFPEIAGEGASEGYGYPPPYTRHQVFPSTEAIYFKYPYKTVGVLFFSQNGFDYRCSASSIGNYAVWTAGHCIADGAGNWSSNFLFIPGYRDGSPIFPLWVWTGQEGWTFTDWAYSGNFCLDMGGVVLYKNNQVPPKKVSQRVGWLGFAWNWPRDMHWFELGYPSAPPFDGNRMFICASSHSVDDNPGCTSGAATVGTGCDQTPGCSGGPWIMDFLNGNYVNGNFSYHYGGFEQEKFSPYFDDNALALYNVLVTEVP